MWLLAEEDRSKRAQVKPRGFLIRSNICSQSVTPKCENQRAYVKTNARESYLKQTTTHYCEMS